MAGGSAAGSTLVLVCPYGPLVGLALRAHELASTGRCEEALAAADVYESVARAFGDDSTVDFLIQSRMYAYENLGHLAEASAAGRELLRRHRAAGNVLGEAKVLADLGGFSVLSGQIVEGMGYLARAGLLLEHTSQRNGRYAAALGSFAVAAAMAGLYEIAGSTYEQVAQYHAVHGRPPGNYFEQIHLELLVSWGLQLEQLGHTLEAGVQLRRAAAISADWLDAHREMPQSGEALEMVAFRALALAKLGHADQAIALAQQVVEPLRASDLFGRAWIAHLALGVGLRARGDLTAARRELLAAQQFCGDRSGWIGHELILAHELATIDAQIHGPQISGALVEALRLQSRLLWQQRLQRLAMLRQARHREELETERVHTQTTLLRDPLTGLGNRRQFDQLMTAIDAAALPGPVSLLIVDVDEFKAINDTHSHSAGDQVLRELAGTLAAHCRDSRDIPVRYAGDEFTIFLNADLPAAAEIAERIRTAVAAIDLDHITPGMPVTISVGVAELHPGMTAADLFHTADSNLYQAKRNGRDRVAA